MDRNSYIGLLLIVALVIGYIYMNAPSEEQLKKEQMAKDSVAMVQENAKKMAAKVQNDDAKTQITDTNKNKDTTAKVFKTGDSQMVVIENEELKVWVNTMGGKVAKVELKKYTKANRKDPVTLMASKENVFGYVFNSRDNSLIKTEALYFEPAKTSMNVKSGQTDSITFRAKVNDNSYIEQKYILSGSGFKLGYSLKMKGMDTIIAQNSNYLSLNMQTEMERQEAHSEAERNTTTVYYHYDGEELDFINERKDEKKTLTPRLKWVSFKQQFFNITLDAKKSFLENATIEVLTFKDTSRVKMLSANLMLPYNHSADESFDMEFYFGPNHYNTLEKSGIVDHQRIVPLGWGIFGWVNRGAVIPVFDFLSGFNLNYGLIILLLTLLIKMILFPLVYKSYMSTAKMRILKPEIDAIKQKYPNDFQKSQQETMGFYRKAGVSPLGGCLPILLQMPILIAMFQFFPSAFELRQQSFLWSGDLSAYDSIWDFGYVPVVSYLYGDHVSLFTILMTISSLLFTMMNNQLTAASGQMKYMGYIMPIIFLGFFNKYASGLTWYYFLSNCVTMIQQISIRKLVNEDALHAQIQANKKKPVTKSKFAARIEEMAKKRGLDPNTGKRK